MDAIEHISYVAYMCLINQLSNEINLILKTSLENEHKKQKLDEEELENPTNHPTASHSNSHIYFGDDMEEIDAKYAKDFDFNVISQVSMKLDSVDFNEMISEVVECEDLVGDYLQKTYQELLNELCKANKYQEPMYTPLFIQSSNLWKCKVLANSKSFISFRMHNSQELAMEDCAGDAFKFFSI